MFAGATSITGRADGARDIYDCEAAVTRWNLKPVEQAFADAALDPNLWVRALDAVTEVTGSFGAVLLPIKGSPIPNVPFTERLAASVDSYFRESWHLRDERKLGVNIMLNRGVTVDLDTFSLERINRHPYYQEFLAPHRLRWFAGVRMLCGEDLWCLSIQRSIEQGPFSDEEKEQLACLSDSLSTSAALARAFGSATSNGAMNAFELSGTAAVLINRMGQAFKMNGSAERLLKGEVRIVRRTLVARDNNATVKLNQAIRELLWQRSEAGLSPPVLLPRTGKRPLFAYPAKLSSLAANALADCQAIVVLVDPDDISRPPEALLRVIYGLSEAEARLAAQLTSGETLQTTTERLGIAKETGRSQLKGVFAKLGVHRQAELVAVLAPLLGRTRQNGDSKTGI
jgi:DNA-binding CsgD family transcriptional regulator